MYVICCGISCACCKACVLLGNLILFVYGLNMFSPQTAAFNCVLFQLLFGKRDTNISLRQCLSKVELCLSKVESSVFLLSWQTWWNLDRSWQISEICVSQYTWNILRGKIFKEMLQLKYVCSMSGVSNLLTLLWASDTVEGGRVGGRVFSAHSCLVTYLEMCQLFESALACGY